MTVGGAVSGGGAGTGGAVGGGAGDRAGADDLLTGVGRGAGGSGLGLIWAQARGGAIGRKGTMPWHLPEDLANFKRVTWGAPVIMGRRTWESLPERFRPLPGRENIVVTRDPDYAAEGSAVVGSLEGALSSVVGPSWVMGGGELYRAAMPFAEELVVTRIELDVPDADTFAPEIGPEWRLVDLGEPEISRTGLGYCFERWVRI